MNERDEPVPPHTLARSAAALPPMGVDRVCAVAGGAAAAAAGDEPPRKRARPEEPAALRRRILEFELARLRALRDSITEHLGELYFLHAGGNMMDYGAWRKRPPAPQLLAFVEARRPAGVAVAPPAPAPPAADEVVAKARQEAHVAARVAELARAGLWPERRLPRVLEPPRPKSHWDYLLEEMAWLAQDFAHERKWKKQAARKCARAVHKHFQDKAAAALRAERAHDLHLRKVAAFAAKEVRTFWANVEKLVEWKRARRVERARKAALDEQLSYIVDRTERYSRALAAGLCRPAPADTPPSDDEFTPRGPSDDDEESIAAAERAHPTDRRAELAALRRDSRTALPALLPPGYAPGDYAPPPHSDDDESTIEEQERAERRDPAAAAAAELDELRADADLSLDELRRRYAGAPPPAPASSGPSSSEASSSSGSEAESDGEGALAALVDEAPPERGRRVERAASLAAALQPTGTTLSETAVGTPVPRLLRHALREYQHVGLHWLATMHARRLNGILADEMGLGKTVQTIALLAHLALERADWGPHLVVAPTSVVLNWEMEFKKWCPAFKILTYYGTIKERKLKRVGWTKANSFHVCITSYKLVVQDHQSFRRKRWKYLVLDEAQNIKNFKSQRWQLLLNFQTERRLLLTGTPLQNSLLELWSLMHFLMPDVFASHSEFREWFGEVGDIADGSQRHNEALVRRLHAVLRPFLLRRLKRDVERQMPRKYEHVLLCRLSRRQRFLYDDFMARAHTRESLASGNLLGVINVLMQLRKVCNHPDLFEPRPVTSPLRLEPLALRVPAAALVPALAARLRLAARLGGDLAALEAAAGAFAAHRARHLAPPRRLVEEIGAGARAPPAPPPASLRLHLRLVARAPPPPGAPPAPPPPPPAAPPAPAAPAPPRSEGAGAARLEARRRAALRRLAAVNERRCWRLPLYGADLRAAVHAPPAVPPRSLDAVLAECRPLIDRFSVCWRACVAEAVRLEAGAGGGAREWRRAAGAAERAAAAPARAALSLLHGALAPQLVAFPQPALLQYDCGKLQTLAALLRRLKAGGHRVLIFTQMTRVLDVLERFLALHGHAYLRLDGATRVDARQALVDRFNGDRRVFAFILSTRSGGVGLNLTGADSVVFYDSDWNPTMDAQAQDRAHRIGQTRDVHVFRLVTADTVEENILRKAHQKRALGDLAIERGRFTTSCLRGATVAELFGQAPAAAAAPAPPPAALESALAAAEDEADAAAAAAARAEQTTDLAEFDETLPLDDGPPPDAEPPDDLAALAEQLTPVERYAMRLLEGGEAAAEAERAALGEMRRQLREWERARASLRASPAPPAAAAPLTFGARGQTWVDGGGEEAPLWCPPTPPQGAGDVYRDSWAGALYRPGPAPEALLPPAPRRPAAKAPPARRAPARPHHAPLSLFERCGRRAVRPRAPSAPHAPPAAQPEWTGAEDAALRRALRLQRLPSEPPPARAPNWDWVAELVADAARAYRSPRACRDRHDALADPERARRRHRRPPPPRRRRDRDPPRAPLARLDAVRAAHERRGAAPRRRPPDADPPRNPKHAALLADHGLEYDAPPSPMEVAARRAERIAREKLKASAPAAPPPPAPAPAPRLVVAAPPRARAPPPQLVYRPQPFPARHLKIVQQPPAPAPAAPDAAAGALRKLQLQQLALRRAGAAAAGGAPHVVVAHLAPRPPDPSRQ